MISSVVVELAILAGLAGAICIVFAAALGMIAMGMYYGLGW